MDIFRRSIIYNIFKLKFIISKRSLLERKQFILILNSIQTHKFAILLRLVKFIERVKNVLIVIN